MKKTLKHLLYYCILVIICVIYHYQPSYVATVYGSELAVRTFGANGDTPNITLSSASGNSGGQVTVNLSLANVVGKSISDLSIWIEFDPDILENPTAVIGTAGSAAQKELTYESSEEFDNTLWLYIYSWENYNVIGNGIIASITFDIKSNLSDGTYTQLIPEPYGYDPDYNDVDITGTGGTITVAGGDTTTEGINPPNGASVVDRTLNPNDSPVYVGNIVNVDNVATLTGQMELSVDFPAYNRPVDIWVLVALPDGRSYMVDESGNIRSLSEGLFPIASGVSGTKIQKQIIAPFTTESSGTQFDPWPDAGFWWVYWLIAPDSNGDLMKAIDKQNYELGFYSFAVNNGSDEEPVPENVLKVFTSSQSGTLRTTDNAEITVQAGAVPIKSDGSPGEVSFSIESNVPEDQWPAPLPSGYEAISGLYRFGPSSFVFAGTVQIYLPAGSASSPAGLVILRYNEATSAWMPLVTNDIDSTDRRIGASVLELGSFILAYNPLFDTGTVSSRQTQRDNTSDRVGGVIYEHPGENYYYTMTITAVTYNNPNIAWTDLTGATAGTGSEPTGGPRGFVSMGNIPQGLYTIILSRTRPGTLSTSPVTYTYSMPTQVNVVPFTRVAITWDEEEFEGWTHLSLPAGGQWQAGVPTTWPQPTVPYGTGDLGITLTWQNNEGSATDLDLHLYGPNSMHIYYDSKKSSDGSLSLDRDWQSEIGKATENIFSSGTYPSGEYKVLVNLYNGSDKDFDVRVQRGNQVQTFHNTVTSSNTTITILTFQNTGTASGISGNVVHWVKEFQDDLPEQQPLQGARVIIGTGFNATYGAATTLEYESIAADVTTDANGAFTAIVANLGYDVFFWKDGYVPVSYNTASTGFNFQNVELGRSSTPAHNTLYLQKKQ